MSHRRPIAETYPDEALRNNGERLENYIFAKFFILDVCGVATVRQNNKLTSKLVIQKIIRLSKT